MREILSTAVKTAMKAGDKLGLGTLRMVQAAIHDRDIVQRGAGKDAINDDEITALLRKMIKQRDDAIAMYETGGRTELAANERAEIAIIAQFLPQQMSADDVTAACKAVIAELGATSAREMGKCMALLKERFPGKMDFQMASATIKALLS